MKKLLISLFSLMLIFTNFTKNVYAFEDFIADGDVVFDAIGAKQWNNFTIPAGSSVTLTEWPGYNLDIIIEGDINIQGTFNPANGTTLHLSKDHTFTGIDFYFETGADTSPIAFTDFSYRGGADNTFHYNSELGLWLFGNSYYQISDITYSSGIYEYGGLELSDSITLQNDTKLIIKGPITDNHPILFKCPTVVNAEVGSSITFYAGTTFEGIDLYKNDGTTLVTSPITSFTTFQYNGTKWVSTSEEPVEDETLNKFKNDLCKLNLAIGAPENNIAIDYAARMIYDRFICSLSDSNNHKEYYDFFNGISFENFKNKISIDDGNIYSGYQLITQYENTGTSVDYFKFKIDGISDFVGPIYKLGNNQKLIIKNGTKYYLVEPGNPYTDPITGIPSIEGKNVFGMLVEDIDDNNSLEYGVDYEIFGNYIVPGKMNENLFKDNQNFSKINSVLIDLIDDSYNTGYFNNLTNYLFMLYINTNEVADGFYGVTVYGDENTELWNPDNLPVYSASDLLNANIFKHANSVIITDALGCGIRGNITSLTFKNGLNEWNGCTITHDDKGYKIIFNPNYSGDIPLLIRFSDVPNVSDITLIRTEQSQNHNGHHVVLNTGVN